MAVYGPLTLDAAQWGRERIVINGEDVSWWRGFHTQLEERSHAVPFGWRSCTLFFPQATGHETLGVGDRSFLRRGVNVDVQRVKPDGTIDRANPLFEGFITRVNPTKTETTYGIRVECVGYLYQADQQVRTPHELGLRRPDAPLGTVVSWALNNIRGRRYKLVRRASTPGVKTRKRGSMSQSPMNFAAELLAESWDANGDRWTVLDRAAGRRAHVVKKKKITDGADYTISYGAQGVTIDAVDDLTERANVIYGSGIRPDGGAWSNFFFPEGTPDTPPPFPLGAGHYTPGGADSGFVLFADEIRRSGYPDFDSDDHYLNDDGDVDDVEDFQRRAGLAVTGNVNAATWDALFQLGSNAGSLAHSYHLPLAWDTRVEPYLYNGQGERIGNNPAFDPTVLRVEKWVDYGAGVTKREARRSARRELHTTDDPAWVLNITLRTNPIECHRNKMKAGTILFVKHFAGGINAYIADVTPRNDGSVQITADTQARDYMTLAQIIARNKEQRSDPARGILRKASRGRTSFDQSLQFDAESPAGRAPKRFAQGGRWRIRPMLFGGWGTIVKTEWHSDVPAQFWLGVFWKRPTVAQLTSLVGNPATTTDAKPWDVSYDALADLGLLMAYGTKDSPGGYWPHDKTDTPTPALTGDYTDDLSFDWATDPDGRPVLYIAEFTDRDTTTWGRFYNQAQPL